MSYSKKTLPKVLFWFNSSSTPWIIANGLLAEVIDEPRPFSVSI